MNNRVNGGGSSNPLMNPANRGGGNPNSPDWQNGGNPSLPTRERNNPLLSYKDNQKLAIEEKRKESTSKSTSRDVVAGSYDNAGLGNLHINSDGKAYKFSEENGWEYYKNADEIDLAKENEEGIIKGNLWKAIGNIFKGGKTEGAENSAQPVDEAKQLKQQKAQLERERSLYETAQRNNPSYDAKASIEACDIAIAEVDKKLAMKAAVQEQYLASDFSQDPEYKRLAEEGAKIEGYDKGGYIVKGNKINYAEKYRDSIEANQFSGRGSGIYADVGNLWLATEEEKEKYNYLLAVDEKDAESYLDTLRETCNLRAAQEVAQSIESDKGASRAIRETLQALHKGNQSALLNFEQNLSEKKRATSADEYTAELVQKNIAERRGDGYNWESILTRGADTIGNMLPSLAVGAINPVAGSVMMGLTTAGGEYKQALEDGRDKEQAKTVALAKGVVAGGLSHAIGGIKAFGGISKHTDKLVNGLENSLARGFAKFGISELSETGEELLENKIGTLIENAVYNENNSLAWSDEDTDTVIMTLLTTAVLEAPHYLNNKTPTDNNTEPIYSHIFYDDIDQPQNTNNSNADSTNRPSGYYDPKTNTFVVTDDATRQNPTEGADYLINYGSNGQEDNPTQLHIDNAEGKSSSENGEASGSTERVLSPKSVETIENRGAVYVDTNQKDNTAFTFALERAKASNPKNGWAVSSKTVEELEKSGARVYMNDDLNVGFAITADGEIVGVFSNEAAGAPSDYLDSIIPQAIANGGIKLECYGDTLLEVYAQYGFKPVAKVKFDPENAPKGWTPDKGTPDKYIMMHNGDTADNVVARSGSYVAITAEQIEALPYMEYDEALNYRDGLIEQQAEQRNSFSNEVLESILLQGRVNATDAKTILKDPALRQSFEEKTGIKLDGNEKQSIKTIQRFAREYSYTQQQNTRLEQKRQAQSVVAEFFGKKEGDRELARKIAETPELRQIVEQITGKALPINTDNAVKRLIELRRADKAKLIETIELLLNSGKSDTDTGGSSQSSTDLLANYGKETAQNTDMPTGANIMPSDAQVPQGGYRHTTRGQTERYERS